MMRTHTIAFQEKWWVCQIFLSMEVPLTSTSDVVVGSLENSDKTINLAAVSVPSDDKVDECECSLVDSPPPSSSNLDDRPSVNSDDNRSLSAPSVMSTNKVDENESVVMYLPLPSTRNAVDSCLGMDGTPCYSFSTRDKPEIVYQDHVKFNDCAYMGKGPIVSEAVSYESKPVDMLCAPSIREPNGSSSTQTYALAESPPLQSDTSEFVAGSSENKLERYPKNYESNLSVSSEIGDAYGYGVGAHDPNMETVDLSPDVKEDQESIVLNGTFGHSFSLRRRNFRYYKKLIQDAFTSRKRLTKEYEHLAILYGDINFESSEHSCSSSVPASPNRYAHTARSQLSQETSGTEWELL